MATEPRLRVVETPAEDREKELARKYAGAQVDAASWRRRYYDLKEEVEAEEDADPLWALAHRLFVYQGRASGHTRCEWTRKRFRMAKRQLRKKEGLEMCLRAIAGNLADPWKVEHGKVLWEDVFGSPQKFEECLAKCPKDWKCPPGAEPLL